MLREINIFQRLFETGYMVKTNCSIGRVPHSDYSVYFSLMFNANIINQYIGLFIRLSKYQTSFTGTGKGVFQYTIELKYRRNVYRPF